MTGNSMALPAVAADFALQPAARRWAALFVLLAGTLLSPLDFFIVNVALPSIRTDLGATPASVELVLSGYSSAYAVLLITGGRLGDIYGRRLIFLIGLIGFGAASALCGFANSPDMLVASRVLQGGFAAILMPQSLATIRALFSAEERPRALGFYAATFGIGAVAGQLLGGLLIAANPFGLGWRSIFLVNLPIVVLIVPFAIVLLRENREGHAQRLDLGGVVLLGIALSALILPLVEGREQGWPLWSIAMLVASLPLLLTFWRYEQRVSAKGGDPLVVPALLFVPGLARGLVATLFFYVWATFFLLFAVYRQAGWGDSPLQAGLAILPLGIGFMISPIFSAWFTRLVGARAPALALLLLAAGIFASATVALVGNPWMMMPVLFAIGLGQGLALPTLVRTIVDRVNGRWSGLAAGLVSSVLQIGGSLGVALIGGLFYTVLADRSGLPAVTQAFTVAISAMGVALLVAAFLINGVRLSKAL